MPYSNIWDITQPPDTQAANLLGQDLRTFRQDTMQRVAFMSGTLAGRPVPETTGPTVDWTGLLYFATDTNQVFQWSGTAWVDISASMVAGAIASSGGPIIISGVPAVGAVLTATGANTADWGAGVAGFKVEGIESAIVTVANTIIETQLYSFALPGNELNTNQTLNLVLYGDYGQGPVSGDGLILRYYLDSTILASMTVTLPAANNQRWQSKFDLFCVVGGAGGSVEGHSDSSFFVAEQFALGGGGLGGASAPSAFDMTAAHTLKLTAQWSNNTVQDTITKRLSRLIRLG